MTEKIWVYAYYDQYSKEVRYSLSTYEKSPSSGQVLVSEHEITFETLEEKEAKVKIAAALKEHLSEMRAAHYKEQQETQEKINELLSLEYKPEPETEIVHGRNSINVSSLDDDISF